MLTIPKGRGYTTHTSQGHTWNHQGSQEAEERKREHGGRVIMVASIGKAKGVSILGVASLNYFHRL